MYESPKTGSLEIKGAYKGSTPARRCYVGGTLVYQGFGPASEQEFIHQTAAGGPAQLLKVYGKTIVWNQLVDTPHLTGTSTNSWQEIPFTHFPVTTTHKYALLLANWTNLSIRVRYPYISGTITANSIITPTADGDLGLQYIGPAGSYGAVDTYVYIIDLTLLYGTGNEPASVAAFLADYPEYDPTYDPGSLQSNKTAELRAERIPVINVWDEDWEVGGVNYYGITNVRSDRIRLKSPIPVIGGATYYIKSPSSVSNGIAVLDENLTFVSNLGTSVNRSFTIPSNGRYIFFDLGLPYGLTYNHDICINLSDPAINGQYFPHWRGSLSLNLSTLTGRLNGEGASVVVFPDGLRGVGTARDEAYGSTGEVARAVVDLGSLGWGGTGTFFSSVIADMASDSSIVGMLCTKYKPRDNRAVSEDKAYYRDGGRIFIQDSAYTTAAAFQAAVSGVEFEYPLATPLTYTLDTPLPTDLTCEQGDILQRVSDNNCPFVGEMKFGL